MTFLRNTKGLSTLDEIEVFEKSSDISIIDKVTNHEQTTFEDVETDRKR